MRRGRILILLSILCLSATPATSLPKRQDAPPPAWDAALFRQDTGVVSGHLDFLYWKTLEGSLSYALKMNSSAWNPAVTYPIGHYKNAQYNIDPGFRVAASYFRAAKSWEVWGMYTRMTSRGKQTASPPSNPGEFLDGVWPTFLGPLTQARSNIHLNYNVADMFVDRYFNPNPHLRLRLLGGVSGTWMSQNWVIHYTDATGNETRVRNQWKFGGCGLRTGMFADWYWTSSIYLTLRGTIAAILGPYKNRSFQATTVPAGPGFNPGSPIRNVTYRDTRTAVHLQLILGPSWQENWASVRTELFVGYELNTWLNVQEIYHSLGGTAASAPQELWLNTGSLTLQGLTTRLTVDY